MLERCKNQFINIEKFDKVEGNNFKILASLSKDLITFIYHVNN
jgi:hypothetical protein